MGILENDHITRFRLAKGWKPDPGNIESDGGIGNANAVGGAHAVDKLIADKEVAHHNGLFHAAGGDNVSLHHRGPQRQRNQHNEPQRF